jgi:hypothetical protein
LARGTSDLLVNVNPNVAGVFPLGLKHEREYWLVVTGTMEFYDFPFSWESHHPK